MKSDSAENNKERPIVHQQFPSGGGEMGELIRTIDWSRNPLGDIEHWPQSLRTSVSICLHSHFPMVIWWGNELVKIYNDAFRPLLGSKHPAMGAKGRDVWPEIWSIIEPMLKSVLHEGKATWSEDQLLLLTRNGYLEECYFTFSFSPIYDQEGNVGGVFTAVNETTDEVLGERQLTTLKDLGKHISGKKSERKIYEAVTKALNKNRKDFPFVLIYKVEKGNNAKKIVCLGIHGRHPAAPASISMSDRSPWNISAAAKNNRCLIVDEITTNFDDLPTGGWGQPSRQALLMPISQAGRKYPFAVMVIGVNPHRKLDKKYIAFFKLLADQIGGEISNVLSYEDARRQADALAEIDEAKSNFFSNVSHEFRTPLTLILSPIEDMIFQKDMHLPQSYWENIGTIYRNAKQLLKLVNVLLDFSRIEAGRVQANFRPVAIAQFTAEIASSFRSVIESVGLEFEVKCESVTLPVYLDKEMWEKIVLNLLSNAFKFTLKGKITVTLTQQDDRVKLSVKDTGVGIPENELPHIFKRFHRVENVKGRTDEGTGIGLALIHELVELHHGHIAVQSTPGKGSEFVVEIPAGREHLPQNQVSDEAAENKLSDYHTREFEYLADNKKQGKFLKEVEYEEDKSPSGKREQKAASVLIVDDNLDMREYVARVLGQHYFIEHASNGLDALEHIDKNQPDLIISDVMMPGMNGLELLEVLRGDLKTARIPVMLLSALGSEDAKIKGYDTGADDYLSKPFTTRELLSRVRAQLKIAETRNHYELQVRDIFSQAYVGICILRGPEHIIEFANEQILTYWGKTEKEAINKPALEVFPEVIGQGFKKILDDVFTKGQRFIAHEFPVDLVRNGKKETTYIHLVYEPLREEDGSISGIIAVANEITDLVLTKHSLQESEMQFRNLVMQSPIAMGIFKGRDMVIDLANDAMLRLWGKEGMEVNGKKQIEVVPELLDQKFPLLMREVFDTGVPYKEEGAFARLNSSEGPVDYYLDYSYTPLFEPDGKTVSGVIATVVDLTEQTEARKEVEESENRYRQLIQGLPSPLYTCDAEGRILLYNAAAANLWGREPELYNDMWCGSWKVFEPDGTPLPLDKWPMATTLKERRPMKAEIIIERPDGERRYVQSNAQPIFDADGNLTGATNMLLDITEAKRTEQSLRESEERFRKVADTAPAMIWMTDTNRLTQFFNTAWLRFTGRTLEQEKGRGWEEDFHPDDLQRCLKLAGEAFEARKEYTMEYRLKRHDGVYRWIAENAAPRFTADNAFEGYIGSCMDINDRKNASQELEKRVELRTKELKKANEELEKMNQELTSFAYISSHDLQEPLRKIQTFISRIVDLEADKLSNKGQDYFQRIQKASGRMQQLIEDLLSYSRTNTDERNIEPLDLNNLLKEIQYELQEKIEEKNVVIKSSVLPEVKVVNFQFHQLFTNLISNAIKFSRKGVAPVIVIKADLVKGDQLDVKGVDPDKQYHHISVSDNGIGFDQQYNERIFELFQRLHGRTEYRGTGIGLAICKRIIENHGGVITAKGKLGEGTTFNIYLPVEDA